MLNIQEMIRTNDFSSLLGSTEEEREAYGGNHYILDQLNNYLYIDLIRVVAKYTFRNDLDILQRIEQYNRTDIQPKAFLTCYLDESIFLPQNLYEKSSDSRVLPTQFKTTKC